MVSISTLSTQHRMLILQAQLWLSKPSTHLIMYYLAPLISQDFSLNPLSETQPKTSTLQLDLILAPTL